MSPCHLPSPRILAVAGFVFLTVHQTAAQAPSASPFVPFSAPTANAPTSNAPLEFRGFIETPEGIRFRLYDPAKKSGIWIKLNEKEPTFDVTVKQHNADADTLVVEHQGRTLTLAQRIAKIGAGSAAAPMPAMAGPAPAINVAPAVTQTVAVNPTPAQEAARLQSVADEVARRRALREQAAQANAQPGQPMATPPPPAPAQQPSQVRRP